MGDSGQLTSSAAEIYDEFFVPALFGVWAPRLVAAAQIRPGARVVDVACGTGVLAIAAAKVTALGGEVVGVDLNAGMLAVARRKAADVDWQRAPAEALPFDSESFDAVVSQFGLMFFEDKQAAITEMWRVLRPGGRLAIAVWDSLDNSPGYTSLASLLTRLFGPSTAALLQAPFTLGDSHALGSLLSASGVTDPQVERASAEACFPSIRSWMHTDVRGWTLGDEIDDTQYELLVSEAERELGRFVVADGTVRFAQPGLIATATKP